MTYCLGILLQRGLVLASDSRSNAGVDQVQQVRKLALLPASPDRVVAIQSAGNFVEASDSTFFLQIGETKYGKPILDRALSARTPLDEAAKLALLSFDATVRSNLSVGPPIDMLLYVADSFDADIVTLADDNPYWRELRTAYADGLANLLTSLPAPPAKWGL